MFLARMSSFRPLGQPCKKQDLTLSMVGTSNERPGLDVAETEIEGDALEFAELGDAAWCGALVSTTTTWRIPRAQGKSSCTPRLMEP